MYALGASDETVCLNKANESPEVKRMDAVIHDLAANWKPTGYYRAEDMAKILVMLRDEATRATRAIESVADGFLDIEDTRAIKSRANKDIARLVVDRGQYYWQAIEASKSTGAVIDAPFFKDYVLKAMRAIEDAYIVAATVDCLPGRLLKWLNLGYKGLVAIGAAVVKVLGVALGLAKNAIKTVDKAAGWIVWLTSYAPYIAVGVGGLALYRMIKK